MPVTIPDHCWRGLTTFTLAGIAACATGADSVGPAADTSESGPVAAVLAAGDTVAYVSLTRSTVPGGVRAVVRNMTRGIPVETPMQDGGFDPVQLPARGGDSVEVETWDGENRMRRFDGVVEMRRPPVVVRTGPAMGATDVSLNAIILVVFSGPMSEETITGRTVRITRAGEEVPVRITLREDRLSAEVEPRELRPDQEYMLVVTRGVESGDGIPLAEEYRGRFRTANVAPVAEVEVLPADTTVQVGQPVALTAILRDQAGNVLGDRRVTWSVSGRASLDGEHVLRIAEPSEVVVTATAEGKSGSGRVTAPGLRFTAVSAGSGHTCGLVEGLVYCWGRNKDGQLGLGDREFRDVPALVEGIPRMRHVAAGSRNTCAVDMEGNPYCWGRRPTAEFHSNPPSRQDWLPYRVDGTDRLESISVGLMQACGRLLSGETGCWGYFDHGLWRILLSGPQPIVPPPGLVRVSTGEEHSCGIAQGDVVRCWGRNEFGQLGDGTTKIADLLSPAGDLEPETVVVAGLEHATDVSAGGQHTCALDARGAAYCWGDNRDGQLGSGVAHECGQSDAGGARSCRTRPVRVESGPSYAALSAGGAFTCGVTGDGAVYCWGNGARGQLGRGMSTSRAPVRVLGDVQFASISAGGEHACGLSLDQVLYCWGGGGEGQIGAGSTMVHSSPGRVRLQ